MAQLTFGDAEFAGKGKSTRKERFLAEMEQVVPWALIEGKIKPVYPEAGNGRRPYPLSTMLRNLPRQADSSEVESLVLCC